MTVFYWDYRFDGSLTPSERVISALYAFPDFATAFSSAGEDASDAAGAYSFFTSGTVEGYLAPNAGAGTHGRLRIRAGSGNVNDLQIYPTATIGNDPLAYGGSSTFPTLTGGKKFRVWIRTCEGQEFAGLTTMRGADGWGLAWKPDWTTLSINGSNQLVKAAGSAGTDGTPTDPSTGSSANRKVSVHLAASSGMIEGGNPEKSSYTLDGVDHTDLTAAFGLKPDWETVVISDYGGIHEPRWDQPLPGWSYNDNQLVVVPNPSYSRFIDFAAGGGVAYPEGSDTTLPLAWAGQTAFKFEPDFTTASSVWEWTVAGATIPSGAVYPVPGDTIRIPYDGHYILNWLGDSRYYPGSNTGDNLDGRGLTVHTTYRIQHNGVDIVNVTADFASTTQGDVGRTDFHADNNAGGIVEFDALADDTIQLLYRPVVDTPLSGRSLQLLDFVVSIIGGIHG